MRRRLALMSALLLSGAAHAAPPREARPPVSDEILQSGLDLGDEIETRVDGDLNGDGEIDTAYIVRGEDSRSLHVQFAVRSELELYHEPAGTLALDAYPLGPAEMVIAKGVLVVTDLTGGTTAVQATYRFRGEKARPKMRLIGLDATLYSRTYAHDGAKMSWNVLTGDVIATTMRRVGSGENATYDTSAVKRFKRPAKATYMEDTPDAEATLGMASKGK